MSHEQDRQTRKETAVVGYAVVAITLTVIGGLGTLLLRHARRRAADNGHVSDNWLRDNLYREGKQ